MAFRCVDITLTIAKSCGQLFRARSVEEREPERRLRGQEGEAAGPDAGPACHDQAGADAAAVYV
jgi:hypothetical protein